MRWRVGHARGTGAVGVAVAEDGVDGEPFLFLFFGSFGTGAVG